MLASPRTMARGEAGNFGGKTKDPKRKEKMNPETNQLD